MSVTIIGRPSRDVLDRIAEAYDDGLVDLPPGVDVQVGEWLCELAAANRQSRTIRRGPMDSFADDYAADYYGGQADWLRGELEQHLTGVALSVSELGRAA